jgi:hypothetical protein
MTRKPWRALREIVCFAGTTCERVSRKDAKHAKEETGEKLDSFKTSSLR